MPDSKKTAEAMIDKGVFDTTKFSNPPVHAALVFYQRYDGCVLVVWSRAMRCWALPGGKLKGEEEPQAAAIRECSEEAGILVRVHDWPIFDGEGFVPGRRVLVYNVTTRHDHAHTWEADGGVGWMSKKFLIEEPKTGPWFKRFFEACGL